MNQCRITVLKCTLDQELKERYITDPDYGPCPYFNPGQVFISVGEKPDGFLCAVGWKAIKDEVQNMADPDSAFFRGQPHVVCCNDGCRPVVFLLENVNL